MTKRDGAGQASLAAAAHARCCAQLLSRLAPIIFKPGSLNAKLASCASNRCCSALHFRPARWAPLRCSTMPPAAPAGDRRVMHVSARPVVAARRRHRPPTFCQAAPQLPTPCQPCTCTSRAHLGPDYASLPPNAQPTPSAAPTYASLPCSGRAAPPAAAFGQSHLSSVPRHCCNGRLLCRPARLHPGAAPAVAGGEVRGVLVGAGRAGAAGGCWWRVLGQCPCRRRRCCCSCHRLLNPLLVACALS